MIEPKNIIDCDYEDDYGRGANRGFCSYVTHSSIAGIGILGIILIWNQFSPLAYIGLVIGSAVLLLTGAYLYSVRHDLLEQFENYLGCTFAFILAFLGSLILVLISPKIFSLILFISMGLFLIGAGAIINRFQALQD